MGFLKDLILHLRNDPWIPRHPKTPEEQAAPPMPAAELKVFQPFCDPESPRPCITVCSPRAGCECDCEALSTRFREELARQGLDIGVGRAKTGCDGPCRNGPFVGFPQKGIFYFKVRLENVSEIVTETIVRNRILFPCLSLSPDRSYRADVYFEKDTGALVAIDEGVCMVEVARYFAEFEGLISCRKCTPCLIGIERLQEALDRIISGSGDLDDLDFIQSLFVTMRDAPNCKFASAANQPVFSAVTFFEDEFRAHIERHRCPAGVCKEIERVPVMEKPVPKEKPPSAGKEEPVRTEEEPVKAAEDAEAGEPGMPVGKTEAVGEAEPAPEAGIAAEEPPAGKPGLDEEAAGRMAASSPLAECVIVEDREEVVIQASAMGVPVPPECGAAPDVQKTAEEIDTEEAPDRSAVESSAAQSPAESMTAVPPPSIEPVAAASAQEERAFEQVSREAAADASAEASEKVPASEPGKKSGAKGGGVAKPKGEKKKSSGRKKKSSGTKGKSTKKK